MESTKVSQDCVRGTKRSWKWRIIRIIILVLLLLFLYWNNNALSVTQYLYQNPEVPQGFEGYRIVHLSDLHNKVFGGENEPLLEQIAALDPDLIVLTGDFVDASNHTNYDKARLFMQQISKIAPSYYVLGNHEQLLPEEEMQQFLADVVSYGVHHVQDEMITISAENGDSLQLIGLSNRSLYTTKLKTMMAEESKEALYLLLAHEPQLIDHYAETGVDLVFSGHAHGGQFRIPFVNIGIYAPDQGLFPNLVEGMHTVQNTTIVVSRGLGNSAFPFRLFNRPEIVCVTLSAG
ncbi:MAG: metallophosphoesterase [Oscillospiraceae bacterium]|nr:metallophosphoesterase [Oscillospiraceae bacterium]